MTPTVPFTPRDPARGLQVANIGRVSTPGQDVRNVEASHDENEAWLRRHYQGDADVERLGGQVSGMVADSAALRRVRERLAARDLDLVIAEDLSRISRNPGFQWTFAYQCIDAGVRLVCIADGIDTAADDWEQRMHVASISHGLQIPDTRRRVRRTATKTFKGGGMVMKVRFGYRKLTAEEADSGKFGPKGLRIAKDPDVTPKIREMAARIARGDGPPAVAEWLNDQGVEPGKYAPSRRWSSKLVKAYLRDPILSGRRTFRRTVCKLVYGTGKHKAVANPNSPEVREYPELAHLTAEEHGAALAALDARRGRAADAVPRGDQSPLWGRPRSRSLWPGQQVVCGACGGRMYVIGRYLRCKNSVAAAGHACWNRVQVDIDLVRDRALAWVAGVIGRYPGFFDAAVDAAWAELCRLAARRRGQADTIARQIEVLEGQATQLAKAIALGGDLPTLVGQVAEADRELERLRDEAASRPGGHDAGPNFPSRDAVAARLGEAAAALARESTEFADLLRRLLPRFVVRPAQALDSGRVVPRGELTLSLEAWAAPGEPVPPPVSVVLDLFDPPAHIANVDWVAEARRRRPAATLEELGAELGLHKMTVKRALDYRRRMDAAGVSDPYVFLEAPPTSASRWSSTPPTPGAT